MLLAIGFALLVSSAGFVVLRPLGLTKGLLALGLAPAAGLALLAIVATWSFLMGAPPVVATALLLGCAALGATLAARESEAARFALSRPGEHRAALLILLAGLVVPGLILWQAFGALEVPLSTHDGAQHVETIHALRLGQGWQGWYPPGYHATMAAFLGLVPWVDSAIGTTQASLGLTLLGQLAAFGAGCAVLRRPLMAAAGTLVLGLTYQYPFTVEFWGIWPMLFGLILALAVWATATSYLESPRTRLALVCGLLVGAIGLVHTPEVLTALVILPLVLVAYRDRIRWARLGVDVGVALVVAAVIVAPYLATLLGWARGGGAEAAGAATGVTQEGRLGVTGGLALLLLDALGGFVVDAPLRLVLVAIGVWWTLRQPRAWVLAAACLAFLAITLLFVYVDRPPVSWVFAATYPWSHGYRQLMVVGLLAALLAGAGAVWVGETVVRQRRSRSLRPRLLSTTCLGLGLLVAFGGLALVPRRLGLDVDRLASYSVDDAAAMAWLREHATPGATVANDWSADAGIWAPYKAAGLRVLLPRLDDAPRREDRLLVGSHVASLGADPAVRAAACSLGVQYVFVGAVGPGFYEPRRFPPLAELETSPWLEQVFSSHDARVFRTRLDCS